MTSKLTEERKLLKEEMVILGGIFLVFLLIGMAVAFFEGRTEKKLAAVSKDSITFDRQKLEKKQDYDALVQAFDVYKQIPLSRRPDKTAYDTPSDRLRAADQIIRELRETYKISYVEFTFPEPTPKLIKPLSTESIEVYEAPFRVSVKALNDELVFSFIYSLMQSFPGYMRLTNMQIWREGEITPEVINKIRQTGELPPLVRVDVSFTWTTLKSLLPEQKS